MSTTLTREVRIVPFVFDKISLPIVLDLECSDREADRSHMAYNNLETFKNARAVCIRTGGDVSTFGNGYNLTVAQQQFQELGSAL